MRSIGIRATPHQVYYCILEESPHNNLIACDSLSVPKVMELPSQLKFIRNTFLDIVKQNNVTRAGVRVTESYAQKKNPERITIEAVLIEMLASSSVEKYFTGQISNIASKLNLEREEVKKAIEKSGTFEKMPGWSDFGKEEKECILTGLASFAL